LENQDKTKIIDVSRDQPSEVSSIRFKGIVADEHYAYVAVQGAYISPSPGLWIIDFFYPSGPEIIGHYTALNPVTDVDIQGQYIFLGIKTYYDPWGILAIIDVSDPTRPIRVSTYEAKGEILNVRVSRNYVYLGLGYPNSGFEIVDITNIDNPTQTFFQSLGAFDGNAIAVENNNFYIADRRLRIYDITTPNQPVDESFLDLSRYEAQGMDITNQNIFLSTCDFYSDNEGAIIAVDVSDSTTPEIKDLYLVPEGGFYDIVTIGNYGFAANGYLGLHILDFSRPESISSLDIIDTPGFAWDLAYSGQNLYLSDDSGLYLFELSLYSISGKVVDAQGQPLEGLSVSAGYSYNATTDESGKYLIEGVPEGIYTVRVTSPDYLTEPENHVIQIPPDSHDQDFVAVLQKKIYGNVVTSNGSPFSDVNIFLDGQLTTQTNAGGQYFVDELSDGTHNIIPQYDDGYFLPEKHEFSIPPYSHFQNFIILPNPVSVIVSPELTTTLTYTDFQGMRTDITIPAHAVTETTTITLTPTIAQGNIYFAFAGHAFDLNATQNNIPLDDFSFNKPVILTIQYSDNDVKIVTDESLLSVWKQLTNSWLDANITCDPATQYIHNAIENTIGLEICTTGRFGLFGPTNSVLLPIIYKN